MSSHPKHETLGKTKRNFSSRISALFGLGKKIFSVSIYWRKRKQESDHLTEALRDIHGVIDEDKKRLAEIAREKEEHLKTVEKLDRQMLAVQKSTHTAIPQLNKLHNYFRMRFKWYYDWHLNPYSNRVHTTILALIVVTATWFGIYPQFQQRAFAGAISWDGTACAATGDCNWSTATNWATDVAPTNADDVTIGSTAHAIIINSNITIKSLTINGTFSGSITQNAGVTIKIGIDNGQSTGFNQSTGTFNGGDSAITIQSVTASTGFIVSGGTFNATSGTMLVKGVGSVFNNTAGTFNAGTGTVQIGDSLSGWIQTTDVNSSITFNNLTIYDRSFTFATGDKYVVGGTLTFTCGQMVAGTIEAEGNITVGATAGYNGGHTGTISFLNSAAQNIDTTAVANDTTHNGALPNLNINKSGGTITMSGGTAIKAYGLALASDTSVDLSAYTSAYIGYYSIAHIVISNGTLIAPSPGTLYANGNFTHSAGTVNYGSGTISFGDGATGYIQSVDVVGTSETFANVTVYDRQLTITTGDTVIVAGSYAQTGGAVHGGTLQVQGNVAIGPTTSWGGGTTAFQFTGTNAQNFSDSGTEPLSMTINKASGTVTATSNISLAQTNQDFTITSGTLDLANYTLNVTRTLTVSASGILTQGTGTVTVPTITMQGTYNTAASGTSTITASTSFTSSGTFNGGGGNATFTNGVAISGGTFTAPSGTLTVNYGFNHTSGTFTHHSGTVVFNSTSGHQNLVIPTSDTFNALTLSGINGNGSYTISNGATIIVLGLLTFNQNYPINGGTIEPRGNVNAAGATPGNGGGTTVLSFLINGDQSITATTATPLMPISVNKAGGTLSVTGNANFTVNGFTLTSNTAVDFGSLANATLNGFVLSNGNFTAPSGTLTVNYGFNHGGGNFSHNTGTLVLNSYNSGQSITVPTSATFNNLTVNGVNGNGNYAITAGNTLIVVGILTIDRNYPLNGGTIEARGAVVFGATTSPNGPGTTLLTLGGSVDQLITDNGGTKLTMQINKTAGVATLAGNLTLGSTNQDLTVTNGTLNLNGKSLSVNRTFTVNSSTGGVLKLFGSETITATTKTYTGNLSAYFTGDGDTVEDTYTVTTYATAFNALTINSTDGDTDIFALGNNITASSFTKTAGTVNTNGYTINGQGAPVLSSILPADAATNVSQHPTITFTVTDPNSDISQIQLEIATDSGFTANHETFTQANDTSSWANGGFAGMNANAGGAATNDAYTSGTTGTFVFTETLVQNQVYYIRLKAKDPAGIYGMLGTWGALTSAQHFTIAPITKIVFLNTAQSVETHTVSALYTVEIENAISEAVTVASQAVDLTSNPATNGTTRYFCSNNASCSSTKITSVTITNSPQGQFYFYDETAGSPTITAAESPSSGWTDGTQGVTITPAAPYRLQLSLSGTPTSVAAGAALTGTITAYDRYGSQASTYTGDHDISFTGAGDALSYPEGNSLHPTATDKTSAAIAFSSSPNTTVTFASGASTTSLSIVLKKTETAVLSISDGTLTDQIGSDHRYSIQVTPSALSVFEASDYPQSVGGQFATAGFPWDSTGLAGGTLAPYDVTITPRDTWGNVKYDYTGTASFSMDSGSPVLPSIYTFTWNGSHTDHTIRASKSDSYDNGKHIFNASDFTVSTGGDALHLYVTGTDGIITTLYIKIKPAAVGSIGITFSPSLPSEIVDTTLDSNVVVTAYDVLGNVKTDYTGSVYFTSSDSYATLPYSSASSYTLTISDLGTKTFAGSTFRFGSGGNHTITVHDDVSLKGDNSHLDPAVSSAVVIPVHTVSNLQATAGHQSATLSWTNPIDVAVSKVNIYQSATEGQLGNKITSRTVTANTSSQYTVPELTNGTPYYFTLKAVHKNPLDVEVESVASTQVSAVPADIAPRSVTASEQSDGRVKVDFGLRYDSTISLSYYNPTTNAWVSASSSALSGDIGAGISGSININPHTVYWQAATDFSAKYYTASQGFKIKVVAASQSGSGETVSDDFLLDTKAPRVNSGEQPLSVDATGSTTATLTLLAREDGATEQAIQYRISNNSDMSSASSWATLSAKPTTVTNWALADSSTVYVEYRDPYNNIYSVSNSIIGTPLNFKLKDGSDIDSGDYRIVLIWKDPGINNFLQYLIESSTDGTSWSQVATATTNGYLNTNLDSTIKYYYRVKTVDTLGNISRPTEVLSSRPGAAPDVVAKPTITVYNWKQEYGVRAKVEWSTDQAADSFVAYAKTPLESGASTLTTSGQTAQVVGQFDRGTDHSVLIQQLEPSTKYYIKTLSQNEIKITGASDVIEIETPARIPLIVSGVEFKNTTPIGSDVVWVTNKPSSTRLEFGSTSNYGTSLEEKNLNTDHSISLKNLEAGQSYHIRINATDADENTTTSDDYKLSIPAIPTIQSIQIQDLKFNSATVAWTTNVNTDSQIEFGPSGGGYNSQQGKSDSTSVHSVTVIGLEAAKSYHFRAKSTDQFGNVAASNDQSFTTPADTTPPVIADNKAEVTTSGAGDTAKIMAIITWNTDEPSTSQVAYGQGIGTDYSNKTEEVTSFNMAHTVIIPDLKANTSYQFQIISRDASGNMVKSQDQTIITPTKEKSLLQLVVKSLEETFSWTKRLKDSKYIKPFTGK